jgi:hypothetical protein
MSKTLPYLLVLKKSLSADLEAKFSAQYRKLKSASKALSADLGGKFPAEYRQAKSSEFLCEEPCFLFVKFSHLLRTSR